jgi:hypothetical protein
MVHGVNVSPAQAEKLRECRASSGRYWALSLIKRLRVTTGEPSRQTRSRKTRTLRHAGGYKEWVGHSWRVGRISSAFGPFATSSAGTNEMPSDNSLRLQTIHFGDFLRSTMSWWRSDSIIEGTRSGRPCVIFRSVLLSLAKTCSIGSIRAQVKCTASPRWLRWLHERRRLYGNLHGDDVAGRQCRREHARHKRGMFRR